MSKPPEHNDVDDTRVPEDEETTIVSSGRRRQVTSDLWPPRAKSSTGAPEKEGLCESMPELGTLPYIPDRARNRRLVRLVSICADADLSIELHQGINRIGRQRGGNHIVLVSPEVSRFHAEIDVGDDSILLRDLGSSNGTFVNDQRISLSQQVHAGDMVAFADTYCFKLLIDIALQAPQTSTLRSSGRDPLPTTSPPPPVEMDSEAIPSSLRERSEHHPAGIAGIQWPSPQRPETSEEVLLERERHQLAVLYQISKRCMGARSLQELDGLLINVLERIVAFDRGFIAYQLPRGDWKLLRSPKGDRWPRKKIRALLAISIKADGRPVVVTDSRRDDKLGAPAHGRSDTRLLLPLVAHAAHIGTIFLISRQPDAFDEAAVEFLTLFADIAALAIGKCTLRG